MSNQLIEKPRPDNCVHTWIMVLWVAKTGPVVNMNCPRCGAFDEDLWAGGITDRIYLDVGNGITVAGGSHNSTGEPLYVPVDLYVRQSLRFDIRTGTGVPEIDVRVAIKDGWEIPENRVAVTVIEGTGFYEDEPLEDVVSDVSQAELPVDTR